MQKKPVVSTGFFLGGLGVSYKLFDNMDLRAEWDRYDRSDMDIDLVSAGFAVKF